MGAQKQRRKMVAKRKDSSIQSDLEGNPDDEQEEEEGEEEGEEIEVDERRESPKELTQARR
jgi:hypothetical protein